MTPVKASAGRESIFNRTADYVSAAMGRPANIMTWLVLVVGWTLLFATAAPMLTSCRANVTGVFGLTVRGETTVRSGG
jgi:low affinity Fe/Cu permease